VLVNNAGISRVQISHRRNHPRGWWLESDVSELSPATLARVRCGGTRPGCG
jgi:hypothetical protein